MAARTTISLARRRDARLEARDHLQPVSDATVRAPPDDKRCPEVARLHRKCKAGRHDADDRHPASVEVQRFADHAVAVSLPDAAKTSLRQTPADDDDILFERS